MRTASGRIECALLWEGRKARNATATSLQASGLPALPQKSCLPASQSRHSMARPKGPINAPRGRAGRPDQSPLWEGAGRPDQRPPWEGRKARSKTSVGKPKKPKTIQPPRLRHPHLASPHTSPVWVALDRRRQPAPNRIGEDITHDSRKVFLLPQRVIVITDHPHR